MGIGKMTLSVSLKKAVELGCSLPKWRAMSVGTGSRSVWYF